MLNIKDAVMRGRQTLESKKNWGFDRQKYLNSSEAGWCIRRIWYSKHQPELAEPQQWGYARRGSHGEHYVVDSLLAANVPLIIAGDGQVSLQDEKRKLSCSPDGVFAYEEDKEWIGCEIKTIDPRTNRDNLPKAEHKTQFDLAMNLLIDHMKPTGFKLSRGLLIYMDASNFDDIIQFEIKVDPSTPDRLAKKASKIFRTKDVSVLDREGKRAGGKECKLCAFKKACGVDIEDTTNRKRANKGSRFDVSVMQYMEIKAAEDLLKVQKADCAENIKGELQSRGIRKAIVGNIEVSLASVNGRRSLDKKAVARAGIDLSPFETIGAPSERLNVNSSKG